MSARTSADPSPSTTATVGDAATPAFSATEFASAVGAITSAFGDPTRRDIYLFTREHDDGVTAAEVAVRFDLHANVARHHLDKLTAAGHMTVSTVRSRGAGRPSKHNRVATDQRPLEVPVRHDDIIVTLLGRALSELGEERATALAEEVGVEYGRDLAGSLGQQRDGPRGTGGGQRSMRTALHAIADALSAHGFASRAQTCGDEYRIVSEHCPYGEAVIEHPVICAVDRGMVAGMLGALWRETPVQLASSLARGDDRCIASVDGVPTETGTRRR
ncbi:MAG: helix-turn-helix domain-containing protein [Microthrixaceae bacterium]